MIEDIKIGSPNLTQVMVMRHLGEHEHDFGFKGQRSRSQGCAPQMPGCLVLLLAVLRHTCMYVVSLLLSCLKRNIIDIMMYFVWVSDHSKS